MKVYSSFLPIERYEYHILNKEKYKNIPITIWNDKFPTNVRQLSENPINILILNEPNELFGHHDASLIWKDRFQLILTWGDKVLKKLENAVLFIHCETNLYK